MTDLSTFGAGISHNTDDSDDDPGPSVAQQRRSQYTLGRCRAIATSQGTRCGGGIAGNVDGPFCMFHANSHDPPTIDSDAKTLAQWCGSSSDYFKTIPTPCRAAIRAVLRDD